MVDYPVSLEPPYRPFFLLPGTGPAIDHLDDGRRPTFFSALYERAAAALSGATAARSPPAIKYEENAPFPMLERGDLYVRRIQVAADFASPRNATAELLRALAQSCHPVSFELVGHAGLVVLQIVAASVDADHVFSSVTDYLPDAAVLGEGDLLLGTWDRDQPSLVVDWGLENEFFLPVACPRSFELDPYIPLVAALARAQEGETLCFQVLFERTINPWRSAILDAVTAPDGKPLFVDAPQFVPMAREKASTPLLSAVIRTAASANTRERALELTRAVGGFFAQFERPDGNAFIPLSNEQYDGDWHETALLARVSLRTGVLLSLDELTGLVHLPDQSVRHAALLRTERRTKVLPAIGRGHAFVLGDNLHAGVREPVSVAIDERLAHTVIAGASGTGKSTLLVNMIRQDLDAGHGLALLDPHGDLVEDVLATIPPHRIDDVAVFDPADEAFPVGFNIVAADSERDKILLASDLASVFKRLSTSWGDTMSTVLGNAVLALLESPEGGTLLTLRRFLSDDVYRAGFLKTVEDEEVRYFWKTEWPMIGTRSIGPLLSRLNTFLRPKLIRHIVGQKRPRLNLNMHLNGRKIVLAKLSQGLIGSENTYLLGSLILSRFLQLALARQSLPKAERHPFFLYVDEAEHFLTPSFASLITEPRKYGVGLTLAFQTLAQLRKEPEVASAVLGAHTRILFRLGDDDARTLADGLSFFDANDLRSLSRGDAIARLGQATNDCNLRTYPPPATNAEEVHARREAVIARSRAQFAMSLAEVSDELAQFRTPIEESTAKSSPQAKPSPEQAPSAEEQRPQAGPPKVQIPSKPSQMQADASVPPLGRGGAEHKYLQHLIKRLAEERGFRAVIEDQVGGGQVDVALRRADVSIACEVSITTDPAHELENARKCLSAGFARVWMITPDKKRREKLAKTISALGAGERVACIGGEDLVTAFEALAPAPQTTERIVGGYKVKATRRITSYEDYEKRQAAMAEVIARSLLKGRKKT